MQPNCVQMVNNNKVRFYFHRRILFLSICSITASDKKCFISEARDIVKNEIYIYKREQNGVIIMEVRSACFYLRYWRYYQTFLHATEMFRVF